MATPPGSLFPFASAAPVVHQQLHGVGRTVRQPEPPPGSPDQFTVSPGSTGTAQTIQEPLLDISTIGYKSSVAARLQAAQTQRTSR